MATRGSLKYSKIKQFITTNGASDASCHHCKISYAWVGKPVASEACCLKCAKPIRPAGRGGHDYDWQTRVPTWEFEPVPPPPEPKPEPEFLTDEDIVEVTSKVVDISPKLEVVEEPEKKVETESPSTDLASSNLTKLLNSDPKQVH
jgi:hypothetical protein